MVWWINTQLCFCGQIVVGGAADSPTANPLLVQVQLLMHTRCRSFKNAILLTQPFENRFASVQCSDRLVGNAGAGRNAVLANAVTADVSRTSPL
jgi:hypothetical protein